MRRKDKEITNVSDILSIIERCDICRVGFCHENTPYIVPMNYGYTYEKEQLVLYFHCASEGKKIDLMKANPNVCFEMDCSHKLVRDDRACKYTMNYESIMGQGKIHKVEEEEGKIEGLQHLMKKYAPDRTFTFEANQLRNLTILKLVVKEFTGKCSPKV